MVKGEADRRETRKTKPIACFSREKRKKARRKTAPHLRRFLAASACPRCHPDAPAADYAAGSEAVARSQRPRQSLSLSTSSSLRPSTIAPASDLLLLLFSRLLSRPTRAHKTETRSRRRRCDFQKRKKSAEKSWQQLKSRRRVSKRAPFSRFVFFRSFLKKKKKKKKNPDLDEARATFSSTPTLARRCRRDTN